MTNKNINSENILRYGTNIEKRNLINNKLKEIKCELSKDFHFISCSEPILFTIKDKNNRFYNYEAKMQWNSIQQGHTYCLQSLTQKYKNKYLKLIFNNIGIEPLEDYKSRNKNVLYRVIDKNNQYYGLIGKISLEKIESRKAKKLSIQTLLPEEKKKYIDNLCSPLNYTVLKYPQHVKDEIIIKTKKGNIWHTSRNALEQGAQCPLDTCASFGERCLNEIFKLNKINFETQKTIINEDNISQFMDFYLPDYGENGLCIEYNGIQHYINSPRNNRGIDYQNEHDLKKYLYCKTHDIKYYEIPYIYDSIESITKYVEDKILHATLERPSANSVQYSRMYNDEDIIKIYKKYKNLEKHVSTCQYQGILL